MLVNRALCGRRFRKSGVAQRLIVRDTTIVLHLSFISSSVDRKSGVSKNIVCVVQCMSIVGTLVSDIRDKFNSIKFNIRLVIFKVTYIMELNLQLRERGGRESN